MTLLEIYKYTAMFLTFFVGLCIFAYIGLTPKSLSASAAAIITVILIILRNIKKFVEFKSLNTAFILISATVFFSSLFSILSLNIYAESFKEHSSKHDHVKLKIVECDYSLSYTSRYTAVVLESDLLPYGTNIFVNSPISYLDSGTLLEGEVVYSSLDDMSSRTFDAEKTRVSQ